MTFIFVIGSLRSSIALCTLFVFLDLTFWLLAAGFLAPSPNATKGGGGMGIVSGTLRQTESSTLPWDPDIFARFCAGARAREADGYSFSRLPHSLRSTLHSLVCSLPTLLTLPSPSATSPEPRRSCKWETRQRPSRAELRRERTIRREKYRGCSYQGNCEMGCNEEPWKLRLIRGFQGGGVSRLERECLILAMEFRTISLLPRI